MSNPAELKAQLKRMLVENLMLQCGVEAIADDLPLFGPGSLGLDSVDLMVLVALVDRDYGVEIFTRELGEKVFITLSTLAEYITKHRKKA